jgi:tetrapyrrole methylase family protein/MazG family protein
MKEFQRLYDIIKTLRGDNGCPWDKKQTTSSMSPHLIEETYEAVDAIDSGNAEDLKEELGDLIFLALFVAYVAQEEGKFNVVEVLDNASEKLVRRHPHVFGDLDTESVDEVLQNWEAIKLSEKKNLVRKTPFDGIPRSLPEIQKFGKVLQKIERTGLSLEEFYLTDIESKFKAMNDEFNFDTFSDFIRDLFFVCYVKKIDISRAVRESLNYFIRSYLSDVHKNSQKN